MKLSDHDLLQLTEEELLELPEEVLRRLSIKLLYDLKEARERLRQTSRNSSRPPSRDLPWDKTDNDEDKLPQQGQNQFSGVDDESLNTGEEVSKPESEKKTRTRRTSYSNPRSKTMKPALNGKQVNNRAHLATGANKR